MDVPEPGTLERLMGYPITVGRGRRRPGRGAARPAGCAGAGCAVDRLGGGRAGSVTGGWLGRTSGGGPGDVLAGGSVRGSVTASSTIGVCLCLGAARACIIIRALAGTFRWLVRDLSLPHAGLTILWSMGT